MPRTDGWLERYGSKHRFVRYPPIYFAAALLVVVGTVGTLWALPAPAEFQRISPLLNWGSAFLMAAIVYYFIISLSVAIGLLPLMVAIAAFELWLGQSEFQPLRVSLGLLAAGTIGLWLGRLGNGGLRAVAGDLQWMMIAPAWLLASLFRRLGIPV